MTATSRIGKLCGATTQWRDVTDAAIEKTAATTSRHRDLAKYGATFWMPKLPQGYSSSLRGSLD
jgi:hypothetical protein